MMNRPLRASFVVGEASGDELGADLMAALKTRHPDVIQFSGLGGRAMQKEGLDPLFDIEEIAVMGVTAVVGRLPAILKRISQTAQAIIDERPDVLFIIDSPDFTHRVAKKVRTVLPDLLVINYVCPSVWAWRPARAKKMTAYVDHVLAILPFEPDTLESLEGPPATFIGHPLGEHAFAPRSIPEGQEKRTLLILPGSRSDEVKRLLPDFKDTIKVLSERRSDFDIVIPAVERQQNTIREHVSDWAVRPQIVVGSDAKKEAFASAHAALTASGTVCLELAMSGVPTISTYRLDPMVRQMRPFIKAWSANLPNLILDYPAVPEYFDEFVRPNKLARHIDRLLDDTPERKSQTEACSTVQHIMQEANDRPAAEKAIDVMDRLLAERSS
ncbi:MAG: lipid-A-disaccharide synthase [Hyphomicrobiales bacterium]